MSLAPIPTGAPSAGKITLQPGWELEIDDYNMDKLTCSLIGRLQDVLNKSPGKYQPCILPGLSFPGLSCSQLKVTGGEGLSAVANLEFKGFTGATRNPVSSLTWQSGNYGLDIGAGLILSLIIPRQAQLSLKFGSRLNPGNGDVGKTGTPYNAAKVADTATATIDVGKLGAYQLNLYATTIGWLCLKDDWEEAGIYFCRAQTWTRDYIVGSVTVTRPRG